MKRGFAFPFLEVGGLVLILLATVVFVGQLGQFSQLRQQMPTSLELGSVPVGGLTRTEAQARLEQVYGAPVTVTYRGEDIQLDPRTVNFTVNSQAMISQADELRTEGTFWSGFWDFLWRRPEQSYTVDLTATYSGELLDVWLDDIAMRYDSPPQPPVPALESLSFRDGAPGYTLDKEASRALIEEALMRPTNRTAELVINEEEQPRAGLDTLQDLLTQYLVAQKFENVASVVVIDLETGEEMVMNMDFRSGTPQPTGCSIAVASMSTMKIPIMVDFFRALDYLPGVGSDDYKILYDTMTRSGNISANFMMQRSGGGDAFRGVDNVNQTLDALGVDNTFIAAPYDDVTPPEYYSTPAREAAREGSCVDTRADVYMQTTTEDMARMLDMVYQCATFGGGGLIAAFPEAITQADCQAMIEAMSGNEEGVLILAGVPQYVEVAHKHGWIYDTHADAGIVLSPGGDYVLVLMLWADTTWYNIQESFPLIQGISAATFNYFNPDLINEPRRGLSPLETGQQAPTEPQDGS